MKKGSLIAGIICSLFVVSPVWATPALDVKSDPASEQQSNTASPTPSTNTVRTQTQAPNRSQVTQNQATVSQDKSSETLQNLQTELQSLKGAVQTLENQPRKPADNTKADKWFSLWWQIGFFAGILWILLWIFVGLQWSKLKFWDFGWPWPWWFWIPLIWFIPWLIIAWIWWLVWWDWWIWIWWIFPWIFWLFWWIVLFKESTIWLWRRRKSPSTYTE